MPCTTSANGGWLRSDLRFAPADRSGLAAPAVARFLLQRVALGALVIVFASALTFFFVNLAPGGPASIMRFDVSPEQRDALIKLMGLDRPVPQRYLEWLRGAAPRDLRASLLSNQ